ncbi:MAG TPA: 2-phosphosulfolactate phosphatase [Dehalococcoidia bacterium]|nr:2-phosphosulfolactate phosphatase [Dehalococcoidia bacterium]
MRIDVLQLPPAPDDPSLAGKTCFVVDVLRATSTIATLLDGGLTAIYPAGSIVEGRERRDSLQQALGHEVLLCGEEGGLPPAGYDLGNSPTELAAVLAARQPPWREAVIATSNGTKALLACRSADLVLAAAPLNAAVATAHALTAGNDVLVVCSGTGGEPSDDDDLAAGLLAQRLIDAGADATDGAAQSAARYRAVRDDLPTALRATRHGQTLIELGFDTDLDRCGSEDAVSVAAALAETDGVAVLRRL